MIRIGDHAHVGGQDVFLVINRLKFFIRPGTSDHDLLPMQFRQIERMQRLTAFHQHVIGDVDNVIDRSDPDGFQSFDYPCRTGTNLHSSNDPRVVLRTEIRALDGDRGHGIGFCGTRFRGGGRNLERLLREHGGFAGDPQVTEAIGSVAGHFEIDTPVRIDRVKLFQVQSRHRQSIGQFRDGNIQVHVLFQPVPAHKHFDPPVFLGRRVPLSAMSS